MKHAFLFGLVLSSTSLMQAFAADSTTLASNSGTLIRDGKTVPVTAVYAAKEHGQYSIVFSDSASATARAQNTSYASVGDIATDAIARELTKQGAHPFSLTFLGSGDTSSIIVTWGSSVGAPMSTLDESRQKLHIDREDDQRLEGALDYVDSELELKLSFALDLGKFGHATDAGVEPPAPPAPAPAGAPQVVSPIPSLAGATALLEHELEGYYKSHNHTWPTSIDQPGFGDASLADRLSHLPAMIQTVTLGSGGVITVTFRPEIPKLGGKSVVFTPKPASAGYIDWKCSGKGVAKDDLPTTCR